MQIRTDQPLFNDRSAINAIIAKFWDGISESWREIWGPHIHHGYYENNQSPTPLQAQEKLIQKLTELFVIPEQSYILDVGCGMGGSSIYLASQYQTHVTGITLSPKQVGIATQAAAAANIQHVKFEIGDALSLENQQSNSFDIVWSLESCEQFIDKNLFIQQALRVLKPGGKLMLATWCSDRESYAGKHAKQYKKLCHAFDLPYMPTIEHYRSLLQANGFSIECEFDWTKNVEKSWDIGILQIKNYSILKLLKLSGWRGFRFAQQVRLMRDAFRHQKIKYGVFVATK